MNQGLQKTVRRVVSLSIKFMATALRPSVEDCACSPLYHISWSAFCGAGWLLTSPGRWTCTVCKNGVEHSRSHRKRHISTMGHKNALEYIAYAHQPMAELPDQNRPRSAPPQAPRTPSPHIDISFDTEALSTAIKAYVRLLLEPSFVYRANNLCAG